MCLLTFVFKAFFFFPEKAWTINFHAPASELELNFALPEQVEIGAFVLIFPPFFSLFFLYLRGAEAPLQVPGSRGKCAFFAGRLALHNTAILGRRRRAKKKRRYMHPVFPLSLFSLCYISVCLCAHNKQNLLSIFTYPNNGICADKRAGEPNIPHRRFESYRFCLCAICALKMFPYSPESSGTSQQLCPICHLLAVDKRAWV